MRCLCAVNKEHDLQEPTWAWRLSFLFCKVGTLHFPRGIVPITSILEAGASVLGEGPLSLRLELLCP
jgi:hypothetical protein